MLCCTNIADVLLQVPPPETDPNYSTIDYEAMASEPTFWPHASSVAAQ